MDCGSLCGAAGMHDTAATDDGDPCANDPSESYNTPLHIGAVFIILVSSTLGVTIVLAGKSCPALRMSPLFIALGKTLGTGIILACALIHMLQPSVR